LQSNCHFEFLVPLNDGDVTKWQEKFLPPSYEGRISWNKQRDFSESLTNSPNNIVKVPEKLFTDNDWFPYQAREWRDSGWHSQSEDTKLSALNEELENLDVNNITPIEALNKLAKLKKLLTF
jgi:hypothetical protein